MDIGVGCDYVLVITHLIQIFLIQMIRMGFRERETDLPKVTLLVCYRPGNTTQIF